MHMTMMPCVFCMCVYMCMCVCVCMYVPDVLDVWFCFHRLIVVSFQSNLPKCIKCLLHIENRVSIVVSNRQQHVCTKLVMLSIGNKTSNHDSIVWCDCN